MDTKEKDLITKEYFIEELEKRNYVTKKYLTQELNNFEKKFDKKLDLFKLEVNNRFSDLEIKLKKEIDSSIGKYTGAIMEHLNDKFQYFFELYKDLPLHVYTSRDILDKNDEDHSSFRARIGQLELENLKKIRYLKFDLY